MIRWILLILALTSPILAHMNLLVFAGSTRTGSYNRQLAEIAAKIGSDLHYKVTLLDLKDYAMPFYDADLESQGTPEKAKQFRELMLASDAILISTPEYNGSIPGLLKNTLDWASRHEGKPSLAAFREKKFLLMSASPGERGGARALAHLKTILEGVGGHVVSARLSVGKAHAAFEGKELDSLKTRLREELNLLQK